jgi:hypothetical protein
MDLMQPCPPSQLVNEHGHPVGLCTGCRHAGLAHNIHNVCAICEVMETVGGLLLRVVNLAPGDVLVAHMPDSMATPEAAERLDAVLSQTFTQNVVVVLPASIILSTITPTGDNPPVVESGSPIIFG